MTTLSPQKNEGFLIRITDDDFFEGNETFSLTLALPETSDPPVVIIDQQFATIQIEITDDDGNGGS